MHVWETFSKEVDENETSTMLKQTTEIQSGCKNSEVWFASFMGLNNMIMIPLYHNDSFSYTFGYNCMFSYSMLFLLGFFAINESYCANKDKTPVM